MSAPAFFYVPIVFRNRFPGSVNSRRVFESQADTWFECRLRRPTYEENNDADHSESESDRVDYSYTRHLLVTGRMSHPTVELTGRARNLDRRKLSMKSPLTRAPVQ
jgi:hypothetical protein